MSEEKTKPKFFKRLEIAEFARELLIHRMTDYYTMEDALKEAEKSLKQMNEYIKQN